MKIVCSKYDCNNEIILIGPNGNVLSSVKCDEKKKYIYGVWILNIDENVIFSQYKCKHENEEMANKMDLLYRLCKRLFFNIYIQYLG